jgi:catechol 2,3-dioxygenase-like lactoylglutathione lyase family enzyme
MIRVRDIDHIVLRVRDAERSLAFYRDVLGCALETRRDDIGLLQLRAGRSLIDLVPLSGKLGAAGGAGPGEEGRNVDHFCVRVEPFDEPALGAPQARGGREAGTTATPAGGGGTRPTIENSDPDGQVGVL